MTLRGQGDAMLAVLVLAVASALSMPGLQHGPIARVAHHASPSAVVSAPAAPASVSAADQALLASVNAARAAQGLPALTVDPRLEQAARAHGANLAANNAFTHDFVDAEGSTSFGSWIGRYYTGTCAGENLAEGMPSLGADRAVQMWLASPGHRANMLSTSFTTIGIAVVKSNGVTIAVDDFGGC